MDKHSTLITRHRRLDFKNHSTNPLLISFSTYYKTVIGVISDQCRINPEGKSGFTTTSGVLIGAPLSVFNGRRKEDIKDICLPHRVQRRLGAHD